MPCEVNEKSVLVKERGSKDKLVHQIANDKNVLDYEWDILFLIIRKKQRDRFCKDSDDGHLVAASVAYHWITREVVAFVTGVG